MAEKKRRPTDDEKRRLQQAIQNDDVDAIKTIMEPIDVNATIYYKEESWEEKRELKLKLKEKKLWKEKLEELKEKKEKLEELEEKKEWEEKRELKLKLKEKKEEKLEWEEKRELKLKLKEKKLERKLELELEYTGLHYSVQQNKIDCVRLYLQLGADITIKDLIYKGDWTKKTPLERAVDDNNVDIIYCMIKEFNKDVSSVDQAYQKKVQEVISQVDRDVTNSSKWPVAEKVAKALFTSPLPSHLECEICLDVLDDPVMTTCGRSYCKECVGKVHNKVCPHCQGEIETFPDRKSVRLINELKICCPYHTDHKCQWKGAPSELLNHLRVCDIKPIMCPHGCGKQLEKNNMRLHAEFDCSLRLVSCIHCWKKVKNKDMAKHTSGCPKMPLPCPNKCSAPKVITREEMKQHLEVCPDQVVACKYSELGCQQKMKRKELDQHMSTAMQHHLDLVAKRAIREENARKQLEYANKQLEHANKQLEKKVASLEVMMTKLMNK